MKYNQCNTLRKLVFTAIYAIIILNGIATIITFGSFNFSSKAVGKSEQTFGWILFLSIALIGITSHIYLVASKRFERTVEFSEHEIIYQEKKRTVEMKWEDVKKVFLFPELLWIPSNRIIIFVATGGKLFGRKNKVTSERIWSEYNDEMLEEIRKYWHGRIVNEDKYLKYKNKMLKSSNGEYK